MAGSFCYRLCDKWKGASCFVAANPPRRGGTCQPGASPSDHHEPTLLHTLKGLPIKCTCAAWNRCYVTLSGLNEIIGKTGRGDALTLNIRPPWGRSECSTSNVVRCGLVLSVTQPLPTAGSFIFPSSKAFPLFASAPELKIPCRYNRRPGRCPTRRSIEPHWSSSEQG